MQTVDEKTKFEFYKLDDSKLLIGDIILTTTSQKLSRIIKAVTNGDYSHAMLYVGGQSCIDSTRNGVQSHNIQRLLFQSSKFCKVLRHIEPLTTTQIDLINYFVRRKVGTEYSTHEAIQGGIKIRNNIKELNKQFCSRLVTQAYQSAGLQIVNNPDYSSPEDINTSESLFEITNALRLANSAEIEFANEENTSLKKQEQAHNFIFKKAREITGFDIQTFEQLNGILFHFPQFDKQVLDILIESGYLNLWNMDLQRNPWIYDFTLFEQHFTNKQQRQEIGKKQAISEMDIRTRFQITFETLLSGVKERPLKSLIIQIALYQKLIELSETRMRIWEQAMK